MSDHVRRARATSFSAHLHPLLLSLFVSLLFVFLPIRFHFRARLQIEEEYDAGGSNQRRGARTALLGGVDTRSPLYSTDLLQPLLEVATLLQDKDRWEESLVFIERGAIIAKAHKQKEYIVYFDEAKVTLEDIEASRAK